MSPDQSVGLLKNISIMYIDKRVITPESDLLFLYNTYGVPF